MKILIIATIVGSFLSKIQLGANLPTCHSEQQFELATDHFLAESVSFIVANYADSHSVGERLSLHFQGLSAWKLALVDTS